MGCYLSSPDNNVYVSEGRGRNYAYATASCQGWRRDQEDAEVVVPDFEDDASLFILCDGHGGSEVAKYTVEHFPKFLKEHELYQKGDYEKALYESFIDFDALLRTPEVHEELIKLSYEDKKSTGDNSLDESEANKSIENSAPNNELDNDKSESSEGENITSSKSETNNQKTPVPPENNDCQASSSSTSVETANSSKLSSEPSGSTMPKLRTVVEDVDTEILRKEAQLPLTEVLNDYRSKALGQDSKCAGSPVIKPPKDSDDVEQIEQTASSSKSENSIREILIKQVLQKYFPIKDGDDSGEDDDSSQDSEFDGGLIDGSDDDDEDDDDDEEDDDEDDDDEEGEDDDDEDEADNDDDVDDDDEEDDDEDEDDDQDDEDDDEQDGDETDRKRTGKFPIIKILKRRKKDGDPDELYLTGQELVKSLQFGRKMHKHTAGIDSGCTVVVGLLKDSKLYVASAGDSRCIIIKRTGDCIPMSIDHKPEDTEEHLRIIQAGGEVHDGRVNNGLNLSRAFGDFSYKSESLPAEKQMITPCPDVRVAKIDLDKMEYIFLACDGIWNSLNNNQTSKFLMKAAESTDHNLIEMCMRLFQNCIAPKTDGDGTGCDNMTCILIHFDGKMDQGGIVKGHSNIRKLPPESLSVAYS